MNADISSSASGPRALPHATRRFGIVAVLTLACSMSISAAAQTTATTSLAGRFDARDSERRAAIEQILKHIYAIYLGIRSCAEIGTMQNDRSFLPEVSLEEAKRYLRGIDVATREIGIDPAQAWNEEAPSGLITAEALKTNPETHLKFCQRMGSLFRVDAGNLQANLSQMGAKSPIITKDY